MRTGTRCASLTQVNTGLTLARPLDPDAASSAWMPRATPCTCPRSARGSPISHTVAGSPSATRGIVVSSKYPSTQNDFASTSASAATPTWA